MRTLWGFHVSTSAYVKAFFAATAEMSVTWLMVMSGQYDTFGVPYATTSAISGSIAAEAAAQDKRLSCRQSAVTAAVTARRRLRRQQTS